MKRIVLSLFTLSMVIFSFGQTSLSPGDLAFTSYTSDNPDEFSFVLLEDIDSATVISFTDNGWLSSGAFRANEGVIVWTSGVSATKGTIVTINSTMPSIGTTTGSMPAFSGSGDQVFAFQGTVASPTLLAGLNMDGAWAATATNSNSSALPMALSGIAMAIVPEVDNAFYDCATYGFAGTKSALLNAITDSTNWVTSNSLPNTSNCTSFNVVSGTSTLNVTVNVDSNVTCNGLTNGGASAIVSGGVPPFSYLWSTGDTSLTISGVAAATYSITVIDSAGFQVTQNVTITEPTMLSSNLSVVNASTVGGADGSVTAVVNGGTAPYSFNWNNGNSSATNSNLAAGLYSVSITDSNGCLLVDSASVSDPSAVFLNINSHNISCFGASDGAAKAIVTGGISPYNFSWSGGTVVAGDSVNNLLSGTYSVTVTDSAGTSAVDSFLITEPGPLQLSLVVTNTSAVGVADGAINLTVTGGTPGFTYTWSNVASTEDISGLLAGVYSVTVTDTNGCTKVDSAAVLEPGALANLVITEINYNGPESGLDTSEFIEIANAGSTTVNLNGYFFSQGVAHTFTSRDSILAGQYYVIAFDSASFRNRYGIDANATWTSGGLSNGGEDVIIVDNFGRGIDTVDFDDGAPWPVNSATNGPDGNGSSIELQTALSSNNNNGANWVASALAVPGVMVNGYQVFGSPGNPNTTGINAVKVNAKVLRIYPNPTKGLVNVEREQEELDRIQIISIDGKVLNDIQSAQNSITLDFSDFSKGVYFLRIGNTIKRIVVAR